jgi:hypothetical protein
VLLAVPTSGHAPRGDAPTHSVASTALAASRAEQANVDEAVTTLIAKMIPKLVVQSIGEQLRLRQLIGELLPSRLTYFRRRLIKLVSAPRLVATPGAREPGCRAADLAKACLRKF